MYVKVGCLYDVVHEGFFSSIGDKMEKKAVSNFFNQASNAKVPIEYSFSLTGPGDKDFGPWNKNKQAAFNKAAAKARVKFNSKWLDANGDTKGYFRFKSKLGQDGPLSAKMRNMVPAAGLRI